MSAIFLLPAVWPTNLESIPHASTPTSIIPTKFAVDMTIHCRVITFLSADTSRELWPWPLTFWHCTVAVHGRSRDQPCYQVWRPHAYPFFIYESWRFPLVTLVNAYAATAHAPNHVTREQGLNNNYIFGIPDSDLPIHYATSVALRWK